MAKAKPKYSAAAFRRLLAKLVAAKAEASAKVETQIKAICELASPGFGDRFVDLFRKQWASREDANEYLLQRNRILVWLGEFAAAKRKPNMEKARRDNVDFKADRNKKMVEEFLRRRGSSNSDSALAAEIGERRGVGRSASIEIIKRGLEDRGLKFGKPRKA